MLTTAVKKINRKIGKDKDFKEIAKGGSLSFIINLIGLGFGYLFIILISRVYGPASASIYGKYVLVTLLLRIASIIARFGTDTAMLRLTSAFAPQKLWLNIQQVYKKLLTILLVLSTIITVVVIAGSKLLAQILKIPQDIVIISGFFIIPLALGLFYSQSLRGLKKIGISSFLRTSSLPILNFILLPVFLFYITKTSSFFDDLPSYTFFTAIVITVILGIFYWTKFQTPKSEILLPFDQSHSKSYAELFKLSYPLLLVESMGFIITWIDQLILGIMGTHDDVGIYNLCVKYAMVASLSLQAVNTISAPKFSEYFFKKDFRSLENSFHSTTRMIFWTTFPIVICLVSFPHFFLNLFGKSFNAGSTALILLTIGALINVMTGSTGPLLQMTGHQKKIQSVLLVSIIIEIILNIILIPFYGVTGAAIASLTSITIINFAYSYYVKKYFGFTSIYIPFVDFKSKLNNNLLL